MNEKPPPTPWPYFVVMSIVILTALFSTFWAIYWAFVPEREFKQFQDRIIERLDRLEKTH